MHSSQAPYHSFQSLIANQRVGRLLYGTTLLFVTFLYCLLVILPFYANGIQHVSFDAIENSAADVKSYPPFTWPYVGLGLRTAALFTIVFTPILALVCGGRLTWAMIVTWQQISLRERILWLTILGGCMAFLVLTLPVVPTIGVWLAD